MNNIMGYTRGGKPWEPQFINELKEQNCIGCGRCYKVCSRDVFDLKERESTDDEDDDDFYDDDVMMVMSIEDASDCIGCGSCAKVCPKNCHSFAPATMPA